MFQSAIKKYLKQHNYSRFDLKAVLFDMDGVLLDSMSHHAIAWVKAMEDFNLPFTANDAYMKEGRVAHATINDTFLKNLEREATEQEKEAIYQLKTQYFETLGTIHKMPYAHELIAQIKDQGIQILLVTGSSQTSLLESLEEYFPGVFQEEQMVTAFDVKQGKPSPEPYLKGLKRSGVHPWEAIVIENAPLGVQSGVAAGLFTIAINTGPLDADVLLKSGANVLLEEGMKELYHHWEDFHQQTILSDLN